MTYGRSVRKSLKKYGFGHYTWPTQASDRESWRERMAHTSKDRDEHLNAAPEALLQCDIPAWVHLRV